MKSSKEKVKASGKGLQTCWNAPRRCNPERAQTACRVLQATSRGVLTAREREVVEHTLKGHSAKAIGELLGIKSGTVRIHRRNVYAKLRISSQGELFTRFFHTAGAS